MQTNIGAGVYLLNCLYFASQMLLSSCFMSFVRLILGAYCPSNTISCFSQFGKRSTDPTKSGSQKENMFGMGFKLLKPSENT